MAKFSDIKTLQKFAPFTPQYTTTSIRTATSTAEISSSRTALPLWLSGVGLRPKKPSHPDFGDGFALD